MLVNHYHILSVARDASLDAIRAARRRELQRHHPDRFSGAEARAATLRAQAINVAYEVLTDPLKRSAHDDELAFAAAAKAALRAEAQAKAKAEAERAVEERRRREQLEQAKVRAEIARQNMEEARRRHGAQREAENRAGYADPRDRVSSLDPPSRFRLRQLPHALLLVLVLPFVVAFYVGRATWPWIVYGSRLIVVTAVFVAVVVWANSQSAGGGGVAQPVPPQRAPVAATARPAATPTNAPTEKRASAPPPPPAEAPPVLGRPAFAPTKPEQEATDFVRRIQNDIHRKP